jgi:hypothetical protein
MMKFLNKHFTIRVYNSAKSHKQLLKPSYKTFFDKLFKKEKNFYVKPHKVNPEDIKFYEPAEPLLFKEKAYLILDSPKDIKTANIIQYGLLYPGFFISGYKLITTVLKFKILGSIIWGVIFAYICRFIKGFNQNRYYMITKINLLEDGKSIQIHTFANKFTIDISSLRKVTHEEALYYTQLIGGTDYIPIVIKDDIYIVSKNCKIYDRALFNAITSGNYVKITEEKKVDKEDTIDIN